MFGKRCPSGLERCALRPLKAIIPPTMETQPAPLPHQAPESDEEVYNPVTWEPSLAFLRAAVAAILLSGVLVSVSVYLFVPGGTVAALRTSTILLVGLAGWVSLHRKRPQVTVAILGVGMWLYVALMMFVGGGISAPVQYIFPLIVFMLGWLVSTRVAVLAALLTAAVTIMTVSATTGGWLPHSEESPPWLHAMVQICVFLMAAVLVHFLVGAYRRRLKDLNESHVRMALRSEDLELAKKELHQAQAQARVGSWVYVVATDVMQLSEEACRIFGLPQGATLSRDTYLALTPADERDSVESLWRMAARSERVFEHEHRVTVLGQLRWVLQKAEFERDAGGVVTRVLGITQDINTRKLIELNLRQSEKKFATAFQSSPVSASIATLAEGRVLEANEKYLRDFGWSREELVGRTTFEIGLWPDSDVRAQWVDALRARGNVVDYETTWVHRNRDLRNVSISCEIIDYDGQACILAYITDITERKAAEAQIHSLAFFDALTGLPNRRLLLNRLGLAISAALRSQSLGALLFIDLDNFKSLNDAHGHNKGDALLNMVAARLLGAVREGDTVSRLGGDEFVVMLDGLDSDPLVAASQAEVVAEKILLALDRSYEIDEIDFHNTPSIGVTLFGEQAESTDEPLKRADTAMYQAKAAGRNTIRFFDPLMQAAVSARLQLESDLRAALGSDSLYLEYQPQFDTAGRVCGAEALARWVHAQRGLVSPVEFIPVAETSGLILSLGRKILQSACEQLHAWSTRPELSELVLAVNVSARQFRDPEFVPVVLDVLSRTGADPRKLKFELTESMLIDEVDDVIAKMTALKAHGVGFSLDDFGTGYSSLAYLKRLPLDQLKIDQSFVRDVLSDPNDAAIARMVIVLAETLGLTVIAEGVETPAQRDALTALGCPAFQGNYFSRPLLAEAFTTLVISNSREAGNLLSS